MKKDRQCGGNAPYPVYPPYQGMGSPMGYPMPGVQPPYMVPPMGMQNYPSAGISNGVSTNTIEQQLNTLEQQMTLLDKRVTNLENMYNSSNSINYSNTKYNSSNYQMM